MGRHKTKEEWRYWFDKFESGNFSWTKYHKTTECKKMSDSRYLFRRKFKEYKRRGEVIIISMSGKKATGRPKKDKTPNFDNWTKDELAEVARRYYEITKNKPKRKKDEEASSLSLPKIKIAEILNISRSGLYYSKKNISKKDTEILNCIEKVFRENKAVFGRDRISAVTGINYRRVGRYLKFLELECKVRKAKRVRETKNTKVKYHDLVKRNYSMNNVIATDVSYIPTNKGFVYLSAAINHRTKKIESWNISKSNDSELVMKHFRDMDLNNKIVHSDHGHQYSSFDFVNLSKQKHFAISMSRVGNSLDNREIEYFFSNLKSESLHHEPLHKYSFEKVREIIDNYIVWYNTKRPQSCLQWKTPEQFAQMSI